MEMLEKKHNMKFKLNIQLFADGDETEEEKAERLRLEEEKRVADELKEKERFENAVKEEVESALSKLDFGKVIEDKISTLIPKEKEKKVETKPNGNLSIEDIDALVEKKFAIKQKEKLEKEKESIAKKYGLDVDDLEGFESIDKVERFAKVLSSKLEQEIIGSGNYIKKTNVEEVIKASEILKKERDEKSKPKKNSFRFSRK